jgi:xanthine dehydrogenase accessory factor
MPRTKEIMPYLSAMLHFLASHANCVLVTVTQAKGSTPREVGAMMLVTQEQVCGTIGGGQLEYIAIDRARTLLRADDLTAEMTLPLGPEIGQCCGGRVCLSLSRLTPDKHTAVVQKLADMQKALPQVYIFGAGHVGLALATALAPLPFRTTLIDNRPGIDADVPAGVDFRALAMPEAGVAQIAAGGAAVIMTHDHALDFMIAAHALKRDDLAYVGMIGSSTKRATFAHWLTREGGTDQQLERLTLPIGANLMKDIAPLNDKRPTVIAALVATELLHRLRPA